MKKEISKKTAIIISIILAVIFIPLFFKILIYFIGCFENIEEYRRVYKDPIEVVAVVYDHDYYDDEGDTDFRSYIKYEVSGKGYTAKYEDEDKKKNLTPIGKSVNVKVSPENPENLMNDFITDARVVLFFGHLILIFVSLLYQVSVHSKRSNADRSHYDNETVRKDLLLTVIGRKRNAIWLFFGGYCSFLIWRYPMLFESKTLAFAVIYFIIWIVCLSMSVKDCVRVNRQEFKITQDKLISKRIISGEDTDSYELTYQSSLGNTWKVTVSLERYNREDYGNIAYAVYLDGKKKPLLHYDKDGNIGK